MMRRDDLELSHGATAKVRENAVKQDRVRVTNAIGHHPERPGFLRRTEFIGGDRQSGNPKGRPRGSRNFSTDLKETLEKLIRITDHGKPRTVSTQLAALMRLREQALGGDARALDRLLEYARHYNDDENGRSGRRAERDRRRDPGSARCEGVAAGRNGGTATRHPDAPGHRSGARRSEWCFSGGG